MAKSRANRPVSLHGRYAYLEALQAHWPEVLSALRRDVAPFYSHPLGWVSWTMDRGPTALPWDRWGRVMQDPSLADFVERINYWADHFKIRDPWIFDAAVQTISWCREVENPTKHWDTEAVASCWDTWLYIDLGTPQLTASDKVMVWIPVEFGGNEKWSAFSARIVSETKKRLSDYRHSVNRYYGVGVSETQRDARWAVLFQSGQPASQIASELPHQHRDPVQTVGKAINRFATGVGLTLRTKA